MDNNDRMIRIRYALNISNIETVKIFQLGGMKLSIEEVEKLLIKSKDRYYDKDGKQIDNEEAKENISCNNITFETFLNGLIIYKRGVRELKEGQKKPPEMIIKESGSVNNVMLKKIKIALTLTSDDIRDIINNAGADISKGELVAFFRNRTSPKYVECGDKYARHFLKGLATRNK